MPQPTKQRWRRTSVPQSVQARDIDQFLNALRAMDRTVVEISMHIYKVPLSDRAALLKQHRRLHDTVRKRLPRFLYPRQRDTGWL